jgi:protein-tyrosine phosphatase
MPTVLDWNPTVDPAELVRELRETLAGGSLVVLPGDVGYVVLASGAVAGPGLTYLSAAAPEPPAVLACGPDDPGSFGLAAPLAVRRLMFRAWPAPLTVALAANGAGPSEDLAGEAWERLRADGLVRFRCPEHPLFDDLFPALPGRTIVADTYLPSVSAVLELLGDRVGLAVSAGERRIDARPTLVRADAERWEIAEEGSLGTEVVLKLAARMILFICTGNTCRSPLAEGFAKKILAERLECRPEELPARGFWILSAGVNSFGGGMAMPEAIEVAAELGVDLRDHRSRPVNPPLLAAADDVVAMTRSHAQILAGRFPEVGPPIRMLCGEEEDLNDPIGSSLDVYRECARKILTHLERFIPDWIGP